MFVCFSYVNVSSCACACCNIKISCKHLTANSNLVSQSRQEKVTFSSLSENNFPVPRQYPGNPPDRDRNELPEKDEVPPVQPYHYTLFPYYEPRKILGSTSNLLIYAKNRQGDFDSNDFRSETKLAPVKNLSRLSNSTIEFLENGLSLNPKPLSNDVILSGGSNLNVLDSSAGPGQENIQHKAEVLQTSQPEQLGN